MATETEIKLKIRDLPAFQRALKRLGAHLAHSGARRVHEENIIFDSPDGLLARQAKLLRIRTETPSAPAKASRGQSPERVILTFKQPTSARPGGPSQADQDFAYKVREEFELQVSDASTLTKIIEALGMPGWFRYEKYRTTYRLPSSKAWAHGLLIELDETPIGTFVELEGPAAAIDRAARELGYSQQDYILKNYLRLYVESCNEKGEKPNHMLFPPAH
jgi:adenylate cyclase, class 2